MILKKLRLKNIRSFKDQEIVFPEGSTILSGDIGSGKTSILLGIEFALFGLQPGQRGSSLLSNGEDSGEVSLEFQIADNEVIVERKLKRGSKSISQESASITINEERTESSITEIKNKILEILSYPHEFIKKTNLLYRYTVYTPQEEMKQIVLEDAESRLNILRHTFGIDKYKRIKDNLSLITAKLREESRILKVEIKDLEDDKGRVEENRKFLNFLDGGISKRSEELSLIIKEKEEKEKEIEDIESKIKQKDNFRKEIEKTHIMLANKKEQLEKDKVSIKEIEEKVSGSGEDINLSEVEKILGNIKQIKDILEKSEKEYIDVSSRMKSLELKINEDSEKRKRIFKIDICPTCLQDVSENHKHNILSDTESQIRKAEIEYNDLEEKLKLLSENIKDFKLKLSELEDKKRDYDLRKIKLEEVKFSKDKLSMLVKSKKEIEKDIDFLSKHIENLKSSTLEYTKFDNLLKVKMQELDEISRKERDAEISIAELKKERELTEKDLSAVQEKISKTEKVKERMHYILDMESWLSNDFSNLVSFTERNIMITLREEFSKLFNKWFSMLTTDSFFVHLDENFTPVITQGDFELDYEFLSGGERTAVALAYRLALNQTINSVLSKIKTNGLVILDEPTDGFSERQLDKVRDILDELNMKQLIIVSHEPKVEGFVDNVIKLKKEAGVSEVSYENEEV